MGLKVILWISQNLAPFPYGDIHAQENTKKFANQPRALSYGSLLTNKEIWQVMGMQTHTFGFHKIYHPFISWFSWPRKYKEVINIQEILMAKYEDNFPKVKIRNNASDKKFMIEKNSHNFSIQLQINQNNFCANANSENYNILVCM